MSIIDKKIKECEDISNELWMEGKDEYEYIGELENFLTKWDWKIFHCTRRIEEHRSR